MLLLALFGCISAAGAAHYSFDYDENCGKVYTNMMSMHFVEAHEALISEIKKNPYNLMIPYLADYEDCIILLMNSDNKEYADRKVHFEERMALIDKGDGHSPWQRLCKAGIYLHWTMIHVRFGENYKAAINFRKSYLLLKENERIFPGFDYNKVFLGLAETVIGTIPDHYKWLASAFGMKGDVKKGMEKMGTFINTHAANQPLYMESVLFNAYLGFYLLSKQNEVWGFVNSDKFSTDNNLLYLFVKSDLAINYRKADAVIALLKQGSNDPDYRKYPIFDYEMGNALLTGLDMRCIDFFKSFLSNTKSQVNVKDTWQKLGYAYYISKNIKEAEFCKKKIRSQGNIQVDADKQAERFAENDEWPIRGLLAARLLIDGGYTAKALEMLQKINPDDLLNPSDKTEYFFRMGRAFDESGDNGKAQEYYQTTINIGKNRHEHFAARAALQMGMLCERSGMKAQALSHYKRCLAMPAHDFQNSIDQQAKAGINRLEEK